MTRRRITVLSVALVLVACSPRSDRREDSVAIRLSGADRPNDVRIAFERAAGAYAAGKYDTARVLWTTALELARHGGDSSSEARILTELALAHRKLGRLDEAKAAAETALAVKRRLDLRPELSRSLNVLGLIALSDNRNAEAARYFEEAVQSAARLGDVEGVAKATGNASLAYGYLGDLRHARTGHRVLRRAGRELGNAYYEANGLANEAMIDIAEGDARSAIARLDTARVLYARANRERAAGEQNALLQLATAREVTGDYQAAFAALDTALTLARGHGMREQEIAVLRILGGLHRRLGDHPRALRYYEQAESLARVNGIEADLASTLRGAAESNALSGNLPRAVQQAEQAYELHVESGELPEQIEDLALLADLEGRLNRSRRVREHLVRAEELALRAGSQLALSQVAVARAREADRQRDGRSVLRALRRIDPGIRDLDFEVAWTVAALSARAYARIGALDSAAREGGRAVEAIDHLRGDLSLEPMRRSLLAERATVYGDQVLTLLRLGRTEEALQVSDRGRSRALLERMTAIGPGHPDAAGPRELREGEALLRRIDALVRVLRRSPATRSRATGANGSDSGAVAAQLAAARSEYEALLIRGVRRAPRAAAVLSVEERPIGLREVQAALDDDEALVEYFVTSERLVIFVVTRRDLTALVRHASEAVLGSRIRLLRERWAMPRPDWHSGLAVSRALYDELLAPVASRVDSARHLVIVPHGLLSQLPFAALMHAGSGRFAVERHTITYAPSAAAFVSMSRERRDTSSLSGFGLAPFTRELPASLTEVRAIDASMPTGRSAVGDAATEALLRDALRQDAIVHVATHGVMNPYNPMFSRIDLAAPVRAADTENDGRLEVHELLSLPVRSELVFLSGCETGAMDAWTELPVRGTGDLTLSQAFLSAGARTVVSAIWPLTDTPAAVFAASFYERLRRVRASEALAATQRAFIADSTLRNPYYWAAYLLSGDGRYSPSFAPTSKSAGRDPSTPTAVTPSPR